MRTKFGVDSSSRFRFRERTNRQTRLNALPTPAAVQLAWVMTVFRGVENLKMSAHVHLPWPEGIPDTDADPVSLWR